MLLFTFFRLVKTSVRFPLLIDQVYRIFLSKCKMQTGRSFSLAHKNRIITRKKENRLGLVVFFFGTCSRTGCSLLFFVCLLVCLCLFLFVVCVASLRFNVWLCALNLRKKQTKCILSTQPNPTQSNPIQSYPMQSYPPMHPRPSYLCLSFSLPLSLILPLCLCCCLSFPSWTLD